MAGDALGLDGVGARADDAVAAVHALRQAADALAAIGGAGAAHELLAPGVEGAFGVWIVVEAQGGARGDEGGYEEDDGGVHCGYRVRGIVTVCVCRGLIVEVGAGPGQGIGEMGCLRLYTCEHGVVGARLTVKVGYFWWSLPGYLDHQTNAKHRMRR